MDPEKRKQLLAQGFTEAEVSAMESALLLKVE